MARQNPYPEAWQQFSKATAEHKPFVLHDVDLYRHIRCKAPHTSMYAFEVITAPGYLTIVGDIADGYTFSRIRDMIDFFTVDEQYRSYYDDGAPMIDFRYWAEKLLGPGGPKKAEKFSGAKFKQTIADNLNEDRSEIAEELAELQKELAELQKEHNAPGGSPLSDYETDHLEYLEYLALPIADAESMKSQLRIIDRLLEEIDEIAGADDEQAAISFCENEAGRFISEDWWEYSFDDFDHHFILTCYAIDFAVQRWNEYTRTTPGKASDPFVLVGGGVVHNNPALPVWDLDNLFDPDYIEYSPESATESNLAFVEEVLDAGYGAYLTGDVEDALKLLEDGGALAQTEAAQREKSALAKLRERFTKQKHPKPE